MMMSFAIGGPTQQPPALPRNLTQSLGLPNFTSQYGSGLAQDLRGQLFLFTGNPAISPLIETMAYSQIPNFNMPVSQFDPNNPLNASIDSLYNAPLLQNASLGGGLAIGTGNVMGQMMGAGQTGSVFAPQQSTQQGFSTLPLQQQGSFQQMPQQGGSAADQSITQLQQQIQTAPPAGQGYASPTMQGYGMQGAAPQGFGYGNASPTMQGYGMQGAAPQGFGYGNASPTMQGYGMPQQQQQQQGYGMPQQQQQQQYNPYAAQGGYPPYATAGGQIIYR